MLCLERAARVDLACCSGKLSVEEAARSAHKPRILCIHVAKGKLFRNKLSTKITKDRDVIYSRARASRFRF